jgi:hypothetical protein
MRQMRQMRQIKIKTISTVKIVTLLALLIFAVSPAFSQYDFYYGKNKVMKKSFDWQHIETPHFLIYYYTQKKGLLNKITRAAEEGYKIVSDYLNIKVERKIPIIFYSTKSDFQQTNIIGYVPPSALAFAEYKYYRVVLQGDAPFDELKHTITHELAHIFEYELMGKRARYLSPPIWVMEGFSEFMAGEWNQFAMLMVRDRVLTGRIPVIVESGELLSPYYDPRVIPYDFGHMIYEFLDEKVGKRGIKNMLYSLRGGSIFRIRSKRNMLSSLGYTPKIFNFEFGKYVRDRFKKFVNKEDPEDYSYIIGPDFPFAYSFSHQVSPSGEVVAALTASMRTGFLHIVLLSMKDGKMIKKITPGFTSKYDQITFGFDPTDGLAFTWNQDSNKIAFFAMKGTDNFLVVVDILTGAILKQVKIEGIQIPTSPVFHPTKNVLYFTGQEKTKSYIYSIDMDTNKISNHTRGLLFIKAIDLTKDGKRVVFSAKAEEHYKLYLGNMNDPEGAKQISFGKYNDITPSFSEDDKTVFYSSDELDSYNINSINLETKKMARYTDVKTGNFFPIEIPGEKDQVIMSSFYKGRFSLFKKDISKPQEERQLEFKVIDEDHLIKKEKEAQDVSDIEIIEKGDYRPFKKLYVKSLPPLALSIGTDGGLFGYSYITLTDLMGDHNMSFYISSLYGYRSYHFTYLNQSRRLQLFAHIFGFQDIYYYSGYGGLISTSRSITLRSMYGGEFGFYYPFNQYYRAEVTTSFYKQNENLDRYYGGMELPYGQFFNGWAMPLRLSLVGETTRFAQLGYYGFMPISGHTFKFTFEKYFKLGSEFQDTYVLQGDFRKYFRINNATSLAIRLNGFKSGGKYPKLFWTGGNNTLRTVGYRQLTGNNMFLFNAELRLPLVQQANTLLGNIGPIRGVFFFDLGGIWFSGQDFRLFQKGKGIKLQDAISSYGFGLEFWMFGYPMHVEWTWRTDLRKKAYHGVNFWIGFDF